MFWLLGGVFLPANFCSYIFYIYLFFKKFSVSSLGLENFSRFPFFVIFNIYSKKIIVSCPRKNVLQFLENAQPFIELYIVRSSIIFIIQLYHAKQSCDDSRNVIFRRIIAAIYKFVLISFCSSLPHSINTWWFNEGYDSLLPLMHILIFLFAIVNKFICSCYIGSCLLICYWENFSRPNFFLRPKTSNVQCNF